MLSLLHCTGELRTLSLSYMLLSIMFPFHVPICITTWVALQGNEHRASLIVTVNDMGNYGCYPGCTDLMSMPHFVEVEVSLMREKPLSSLFAHGKLCIRKVQHLSLWSFSFAFFSSTLWCMPTTGATFKFLPYLMPNSIHPPNTSAFWFHMCYFFFVLMTRETRKRYLLGAQGKKPTQCAIACQPHNRG